MALSNDVSRSVAALIRAATAASLDWGFTPAALESAVAALPTELLSELGVGLGEGALVIDGHRFALPGLGPKKGPYTLFTKDPIANRLLFNLEYYIQVAEYLRLDRHLTRSGFVIGFEDSLMDVTVRLDGRLVWYIEAKDTALKATELLEGITRHAGAVPSDAHDRGNDGLRKAKYLVRHRPAYFTAIAVGLRKDFVVEYPATDAFRLRPRSGQPSERELLAAAGNR